MESDKITNAEAEVISKTGAVAGTGAEIAGTGIKAVGTGIEAAGTGMEAVGKTAKVAGAGTEAIGKGLGAAGNALNSTKYGAIAGVPLAALGKGAEAIGSGTKAAGKTLDDAGSEVKKAGKDAKKVGNTVKKAGKDLKKQTQDVQKLADEIKRLKAAKKKRKNQLNKYNPTRKPQKLSGMDTNRSLTKEKIKDGDTSAKFFEVPKAVKIGISVLVPCTCIILFICMFVAIMQPFYTAFGIDAADMMTADLNLDKFSNEMFEKGMKKIEEDAYLTSNSNSTTFVSNKLQKSNRIFTSEKKSTEEKEAKKEKSTNRLIETADDLEDFYPSIKKYKNTNSNAMVYKFYTKLFELNYHYVINYNVNLDVPLLISALSAQSNNMYDVFYYNTQDYTGNFSGILSRIKDHLPWTEDRYDYFRDWSNYELSPNDASHDMEILAQGMIAQVASTECDSPVNGYCYVVDEEQYKEFLKRFFEKKYYLTGDDAKLGIKPNGEKPSNKNNNSNNNNQNVSGDWSEWSQRDPKWANIHLGNSYETLSSAGCAATSLSIIVAKSGVKTKYNPFTPAVAAQHLTFDGDGLLTWQSVTNITDEMRYVKAVNLLNYSSTQAAETLKPYNTSRYYVVLQVPYAGASHYVALNYIDSQNKIHIVDPIPKLCSTPNDVFSCYTLVTARVYEKIK